MGDSRSVITFGTPKSLLILLNYSFETSAKFPLLFILLILYIIILTLLVHLLEFIASILKPTQSQYGQCHLLKTYCVYTV